MPTGGKKTPISGRFLNGFGDNAVFAPSSALFSPGEPLIPASPQPTRAFDFPANFNIQWTPRSTESFGFAELRAFSNVELVRLAIETRKDQIERLDWQIKFRKGATKAKDDARIKAVDKLFRKPDGVTPFASWLRVIVEDMLAIDAATIERQRSRGGALIGLEYVDGATIKPLITANGRRPPRGLPAYQQIIKGTIWNDLSVDDIIYAPRNMRSNHLYGFGPVEQIVVTINTILRRQAQQLAWFTEGNRPDGILSGPEGWTPDQIKEFQTWFDSRLAGIAAERAKLQWTPNGTKYQAFKDSPIKDEFDEWLARVVSFCFSLPPTPWIRQMNRATSQEDQDRALEEGLLPLLGWWKRIADGVIQDDFGYRDLEWAWDTIHDLDPLKQAQIEDIEIKNGKISINEAREASGRDPTEGGDKPMIYLASGAVPVSMVAENAQRAADLQQKQIDAPDPQPAAPGAKPKKGKD
ncbi:MULTISPECIES: phage portal protein [unclassified Bradyrhizobium]|uniref:phage portal protein n=1 Tax=unclassified Bradyrhizobium TaxID=2631580 RepID=UPI0028ED6808|nr:MULTISPECIES: phage portal protein [unclassified Bradyrhizobium]